MNLINKIQQPVYLVGTSRGGAIVAAFTVGNPERVRKTVFINPVYEPLTIGPLRAPILGEYLFKAFFIPAFAQAQLSDFYQLELFPEWPLRFMEQIDYRGFAQALLSTGRNFINQDPTADYIKVGITGKPVLLI